MSTPEPTRTGKGRPTPKRSESTRRRTGPVAPPPQTRKEAAKRQREQMAADRTRTKKAMAEGDPRSMLKRDAGPVRALVRDLVDRRRALAVLLLPLALVLVLAQLSQSRRVLDVAFTIWLLGLFAVFLDTAITALTIIRTVRSQFPDEGLGRHVGYGLLRSTVFRRLRVPRPRVSPPGIRRR